MKKSNSNATYPIKRWGSILVGNNVIKPIVYFAADLPFMAYSNSNGGILPFKIINSGVQSYDRIEMTQGLVNTSGQVPNDRPNFYAKTGWLVVTLDLPWDGEPHGNNLGSLEVLGLPMANNDVIYPSDEELDPSSNSNGKQVPSVNPYDSNYTKGDDNKSQKQVQERFLFIPCTPRTKRLLQTLLLCAIIAICLSLIVVLFMKPSILTEKVIVNQRIPVPPSEDDIKRACPPPQMKKGCMNLKKLSPFE